MGFFDNYQDTGGLDWIKSDEKAVLIADAVPLTVVTVGFTEASQFGPQYFVVVDLEGESRALSFSAGTVQSRDAMLDAMRNYLDNDGAEPITIVLEKVGRSVVIKNAAE